MSTELVETCRGFR